MQSFCHTAAYPKPVDVETQHSLPDFIMKWWSLFKTWRWNNSFMDEQDAFARHCRNWGDSHTRFPIGISFPAGSGLVAFAATLGVMPLICPNRY